MLQAYHSKLSTLVRIADAVLITFTLWFCNYAYQGGWSEQVLLVAVTSIAIYYFVAENAGLYRSWRGVPFNKYVSLILSVWLPVAATLLLLGWATKSTSQYSRLAMGTWLIMTPLLLIMMRFAVFKILMVFRKHGFNTKTVAVVGLSSVAEELVNLIDATPTMGLDIKGVFDNEFSDENPQTIGCKKPYPLVSLSKLRGAVLKDKIDIVYIALPFSEESKIQWIMEELADTTTSIHIVPDFF
ncbi:MAG: hypothetical protein JKY42_00280, partial [Flavobacteriales bacterium]|nr:hypothetical protein [Flavobacteriales bacterium]